MSAPPEFALDHKNKRYDRQLRIWGADGQRKLETCKVCLLHCGPTGSETLKNLVLGGIGGFTVVDGSKVSFQALGEAKIAPKLRSAPGTLHAACPFLCFLDTQRAGDSSQAPIANVQCIKRRLALPTWVTIS